SWAAWLSDGTTAARDRLGATPGPWHRVDGALVAADRAQLLGAAPLSAPIDRSEVGLFASGFVWTGTLADGTAAAETCAGWSSDTGLGRIGRVTAAKPDWTNLASVPCGGGEGGGGSWGSWGYDDDWDTREGRLYCFEID